MKSLSTKIYIILLLTFIGLSTAFAQTKVSGKLLDEAGQSLPYASVSLLRATDSSIVKGALGNEAGAYAFDRVTTGTYIIKATSVGYANGLSAAFTVAANTPDLTVPPVSMQPARQTLKAINITASKPLIERKIDRTVMNVENSVLAAGNSAMEILERAPGVTVDKDDNISLKGKQGVTVMINDKLTYLSATQLATLLRSTDGTTIATIEIITNPSAKYDAAGNSGIINIKLKKNKTSGTNGSITAGVGRGKYDRDNTSINLNHKEGPLNVFGTFSRGDRKSYREIGINRIITENAGNLTYFNQLTQMTQSNHYNNYNVGADLETSSKHTIGFVVSGYSNSEHDINNNRTIIGKVPGVADSSLTTNSLQDQTYKNFAVNLNDRLKIDTLGQELAIDLDYSKFRNNIFAQYDTYYFLPNGSSQHDPLLLRNRTPSNIQIYTGKADYTKPLTKTSKLEAGVKFSDVKTDNDLQAEKVVGSNYVNDPGRTNRFIYTEKVAAAYANLNKEFKGGSIQVGLRAEQTQSNGNLVGSTHVDRKYLDFFPSVFINRTLDAKNEIGLSYSRRIDRPNYDNLNPFIYYLDPYTYSQGNSFLKPQYTNNFEFNYTYNKTINVSLNYSRTTDAITELIVTQGNKSFENHANLQTQDSYGFNVYSPYTITKWWSGNVNLNSFYLKFKSDGLIGGSLDDGQAAFTFRTTQNLLLGKFKAEITGNYQSALTYGIFKIKERYNVDAGVSRSFANKKFNVKLSLDDIFNTRRNDLDSKALTNNFEIRQKSDTRVLRLNLTYNFGNSKIKSRQHRSGSEAEKGRVSGGN
jgi:iron complex outermembrane receptor protein